jgi:hypothetical protein
MRALAHDPRERFENGSALALVLSEPGAPVGRPRRASLLALAAAAVVLPGLVAVMAHSASSPEVRAPVPVAENTPPLPPVPTPEKKQDWHDELLSVARHDPPAWFETLPPDKRPARLPPGVLYLPTPGEYLSERDGSVLVHQAGCFLGKRQVEVRQFARFVRIAPERAPKRGRGYVHAGGDTGRVVDADWRHPRGMDREAEPREPVSQLNWFEARDYCAWAGGSLPPDERIRHVDDVVYRWSESRGILVVGELEKPAHIDPTSHSVYSNMMEWLEDPDPRDTGARLYFSPSYNGKFAIGASTSGRWGAGDARDDMGFRLCLGP